MEKTREKNNMTKMEPIKKSSTIYIDDSSTGLKDAYNKIDDVLGEMDLDPNQVKKFRLALEETITMIDEVAGDYSADIWMEEYPGEYHIKLTATTEMDYSKRKELLSVATDKKNSAVKGFMASLADAIMASAYKYEETIKKEREMDSSYILLASAGEKNDDEDVIHGMSTGFVWSLNECRDALEAQSEVDIKYNKLLKNLEKNIVLDLSNEVLVGVKDNTVTMDIIKKNA